MSSIRYLAIIADDPDASARYYVELQGMQQLGRSPEGDISLTDGYYNLSLLRKRPRLNELRQDPGPHHIGMQVPNIADVLATYRELIPDGIVVREPEETAYGTVRIFDPECNPISLSEDGFGLGNSDGGHLRVDVQIQTLQPRRSADFMAGLFGLVAVPIPAMFQQQGPAPCPMTDGYTAIALTPFYRARDEQGYASHDRLGNDPNDEHYAERRFGTHSFGFTRHDV